MLCLRPLPFLAPFANLAPSFLQAFLGFCVQAAVTGSHSPLDNLGAHLASPWSSTVLSNFPDLFVWRWADPSFLNTLAPIKGLPLVN